jgi:hypothetical protein
VSVHTLLHMAQAAAFVPRFLLALLQQPVALLARALRSMNLSARRGFQRATRRMSLVKIGIKHIFKYIKIKRSGKQLSYNYEGTHYALEHKMLEMR